MDSPITAVSANPLFSYRALALQDNIVDKFTEEQPTYIGKDFAGPERRAFLKKLHKSPCPGKPRDCQIASRVMAHEVWGNDVSGTDRRSVKAQLRGRGDYRAMWWCLNSFLHRLLGSSQEATMYAFHKRHHAMTLALLKFRRDRDLCAQAIQARGVIAGWMVAWKQHCKKLKGDEEQEDQNGQGE